HEFAHQWWGNAVTCANWNDFWLNEGVAEFMMAAYREHRLGRAEYEGDLQKARENYARVRAEGKDRPLSYKRAVPESQAGGYIVYDKGALMLHLLRFELGEEALWNGLRKFTKENFGGGVTTAQFQQAMEAARGKSLTRFFSQWIYGSAAPELTAKHRWERGQVIIELRQKNPLQFPLQIAVETEDGRVSKRIELDSLRHEARIPARSQPLSIRVDDGGHLPFKVSHERDTAM